MTTLQQRRLNGRAPFILTILILSIGTAILGCSSSADPDTDLGPTGSLSGRVMLYNEDTSALADRSGVLVTLENDKVVRTATTASDGRWTATNVPTGTYVISFSKEGFSPQILYNQPFTAPGESLVDGVLLVRYPSFNVTRIDGPTYGPDTTGFDVRWVQDPVLRRDTIYYVKTGPFVDVRLSEPGPPDRRTFVAVLISWASDTSPYRHTFNYIQYFQVPRGSDRVSIKLRLVNNDLPSGERIYLAAYPASTSGITIVNPFTEAMRFVNLKEEGGMKIDFVL